ncbi:endonuclease domain-containing protein [Streptomyces arboris]|uniref:endonuclease domain-containing protein n=2 Tax=Streptomyces arboris TaxID=2600619 RepID=UPI003BF4A310
MRALVRAGESWMIPRTLAHILDQRDAEERKLLSIDHPCDSCGAPSPDNSWRTPTSTGWKTTCPACAAATLRCYQQQLQGTRYGRVRESGPSASDFLCATCPTPRPATDWDHCHAHDLIRGPLCGSCNTKEGHGKDFLQLPGSVKHLMRCDECRLQRALPPHHRLAALRRHLHLTWGVTGCDGALHMCVRTEQADAGSYDCTIQCFGLRSSSPEPGPGSFHSLRLTHQEATDILTATAEEGCGP